MNFCCKVLEKSEGVDGDAVTLKFQSGQIITVIGEAAGNLDALIPGDEYTLAFVPFVAASSPEAELEAAENASDDDAPVPAEHPAVISAESAHNAEPVVALPQPESVSAAPESVSAAPDSGIETAPDEETEEYFED